LVENNETLTKETMNDLVYKSQELYGGNYKELDEYTKNSWSLRSHYYMNFYLFSYSISIAVATAIAQKIINGDKEALNKYLEFLKCGSDKDIKETFEILGVDLEDKTVYEEAVKFFNSLLDKYEKISKE
jgi:oligoendopeptidase F